MKQTYKIEDIVNLDNETLTNYLDEADAIIKFYDAIKKEALSRAKEGVLFTGYHLKETQGSRQIPDENINLLLSLASSYQIDQSKLYETKLLSIAKLEKEFKDNKDFVIQLNMLSVNNPNYKLVKEKLNQSQLKRA